MNNRMVSAKETGKNASDEANVPEMTNFEIEHKHDLIKKYKPKLQNCINCDDPEAAHVEADEVLTELLKEVGLTEITTVYDKIKKWY